MPSIIKRIHKSLSFQSFPFSIKPMNIPPPYKMFYYAKAYWSTRQHVMNFNQFFPFHWRVSKIKRNILWIPKWCKIQAKMRWVSSSFTTFLWRKSNIWFFNWDVRFYCLLLISFQIEITSLLFANSNFFHRKFIFLKNIFQLKLHLLSTYYLMSYTRFWPLDVAFLPSS